MPEKKAAGRPPRLSEWLLKRLLPDRGAYSTLGDLAETFQALADEKGAFRARLWYRFQLIQAVPYILKDELTWRFHMLRNYLTIALRIMRKQKVYSFINIAGLAVSMACALLIVFWVRDELSFDRFNKNLLDVYRVTALGKIYSGFSSPAPFAPAVAAEIPEVVEAVRVGRNPRFIFRQGDYAFYEDNGISTDPALFRMFTFSLVKGDAERALSGPLGIVVSESMARKYFGREDPLGRVLNVEGQTDLVVGGVFADIPRNSHLRFDYAVSIEFARNADIWGMEWGDFNFMTYIMTSKVRDEKTLAAKLNELAVNHKCPQVVHSQLVFSVQRLDEIYLNPLGPYDIPLGNKKYVYLFSLIAILISFIAGVNFVNLTTARAEKRAKEVGLRKVVGAERSQIIGQFFAESALMTLLALLLAVVLAKAAMPYFNALTGKELTLRVLDPGVLVGLAVIACLVGVLAGVFPSLYLSSFHPAQVLKGSVSFMAFLKGPGAGRIRRGTLRRVLVVTQFAISIVLILATAVVYAQLNFIRNRSWSTGQDTMIYVPFKENLYARYDLVRNELLRNRAIVAVAAKDSLPTFINNNTNGISWEGKTVDQNSIYMETIRVDARYFETMGMPIVAGRGFSEAFPGDAGAAYVLNETAVRTTGLQEPVGKTFSLYGKKGIIIGVVKDTYFQPFRQELWGQAFYLYTDYVQDNSGIDIVLIRVKGGPGGAPFKDAVAHLEKVWKSVNTFAPFEYHFLDRTIEAQHRTEQRQGRLFGVFAFLAIFISCLGLFGLASFTAEQRTKEIGIRKTLGASTPSIVFLLSRDFSKSVLAANLIAWPVGWYSMTVWLRNFAYRTAISPWIFLGAGMAALAIAWLTVSLQTLKSARTNPVDTLHFE